MKMNEFKCDAVPRHVRLLSVRDLSAIFLSACLSAIYFVRDLSAIFLSGTLSASGKGSLNKGMIASKEIDEDSEFRLDSVVKKQRLN